MSVTFDHTTLGQRVLFGREAAADNVSAAVEGLGARRVAVIAGSSADATADAISARQPVVVRIGDLVQHVPVERADAATESVRAAAADVIVSVGGGSATGLAKIVALRLGIPIVAVPTTFAGSEATDIWGITQAGRKTTGSDSRVLPRVIVYDVSLCMSLPVASAVSSGLNALAHAVDGFWAPRADPINRALGSAGLAALVPGLRALVADPHDPDPREAVLYGAYLAAVAFASAGSGMHHKICHVLGGAFDLPHADMHAVLLPYVTAFNAPAAPDAARRVSAALGGAPAAHGLWSLREEVGAPSSLAALGLRETDIPRAAELAAEVIPASNPRAVSASDVEDLLRAAWSGDPVH